MGLQQFFPVLLLKMGTIYLPDLILYDIEATDWLKQTLVLVEFESLLYG